MVFTLHHGGFARCHIIVEEEGLIVTDVGSVGTAQEALLFICETLRRSPEEIKYIIATHFHIDHIGGIGRVLRQSGKATRVIFHRRVADYISGAKTLSTLKNWMTGFGPAAMRSARHAVKRGHFHFESLSGIPLPGLRRFVRLPYPTDRIAFFRGASGERQPVGLGQWDLLEAPGHTEDSLCLYNEASAELICGDLILSFDKDGGGYLNPFCCSESMTLKTYRDLCRLTRPERIYPGHGECISGSGNVLMNVRTLRNTRA